MLAYLELFCVRLGYDLLSGSNVTKSIDFAVFSMQCLVTFSQMNNLILLVQRS